MSIFRSQRNDGEQGVSGDGPGQGGDAEPFEGYGKHSPGDLVGELSAHSQVELAAAEEYERGHEGRPAILNKLRYLRGAEPLEDYDALETEQVVTAIGETDDINVLKAVRCYERKFRQRGRILDEVVRLQHKMRESGPAEPVPAYRSMGGAPVSRKEA